MKPQISIVLPVHRVEPYLPACLDSLLTRTNAALEVIAVDDASPDRCGHILDEYASRDPRLRVVHLAENGGLGAARHAGLGEASGTYVWFVDSDDWLPEGALDAVAQKLTTTEPDVLLIDYLRCLPDGSQERNTWREVLVEPPLPETFTLEQRPRVLHSIMSSWNKIVRRNFLDSLDVAFGSGYYEDVSVTYPILLAAQRLSYLDRPCYVYRLKREGAITTSTSPRHFDVFSQYDEIFAFIDRWSDGGGEPALTDDLCERVLDRTVLHAVTILGLPGLVPQRLRPAFFERLAAHFNQKRPAGYRYPRGVRGLQYRLIAKGSFPGFTAVQALGHSRAALRRIPGGIRGLTGP